MKNRKVSLGIMMLAILAGTFMFQSCKKGENDPFLSLKSRDGRVTGEWELTKIEGTSESTSTSGGTTNSSTSTLTYENGTETYIVDGTEVYSYNYTLVMKIEKGGGYVSTYTDTDDNEIEEETAVWYWIDNNKKKTGISLDGSKYEVDRLTNKELILKTDSYYKDTDSDGDVSESTSTYLYTYTKKK